MGVNVYVVGQRDPDGNLAEMVRLKLQCDELGMTYPDELKKYFVVALKSNRTAALSLEDKLAGKFQRVDQLNVQKDQAIPVCLSGRRP